MNNYKLNKISYICGNSLEPVNLNIIIGPNNSGKSRMMKEIKTLITNPTSFKDPLIVKSIEDQVPVDGSKFVKKHNIISKFRSGQYYISGLDVNYDNYNTGIGQKNAANTYDLWYKNNTKQLKVYFGHYFVGYTKTDRRLMSVNFQKTLGPDDNDKNLLSTFYYNGDIEALYDDIKTVFNLDIRVDYSSMSTIGFRIGNNIPEYDTEPRKAHEVLSKVNKLDEEGDGLKNYVTIATTILSGNRDVMLIDEPEAFLHPPQAYKLGEFISKNARIQKQYFIATHSADLLRGIININDKVNIVRIDRYENNNYITVLKGEDLNNIISDPLLASYRVFDGLFYKGVIVCEADSDVAFYQKIYSQLSKNEDIHFIHANGKSTISKIIKTYNTSNVNCAGIYDIDVIRMKDEFIKFINEIGFSSPDIQKCIDLRTIIIGSFDEVNSKTTLLKVHNRIISINESLYKERLEIEELKNKVERIRTTLKEHNSWTKFKKQGIKYLKKEAEKSFYELDSICRKYGLFIVPVGELESWLEDYGINRTNNKRLWIQNALIFLFQQERYDNKKGPWSFIREITNYITTK